MPNVLSPRDLVSRPDKMDETVLSSSTALNEVYKCTTTARKRCIIRVLFTVVSWLPIPLV